MKKVLSFVLILMLLVCSTVSAFAVTYDINTAKSSVVRIVTYFTVTDENYPDLVGLQSVSVGSGFAIGKAGDTSCSYVATAGHVVMHDPDSPNINAEMLGVRIDDQYFFLKVHVDDIHVLVTDVSSYIRANLENYSPRADVAVLHLNEPIPRSAAVIYDKKDFEVNEQMTAMGFPAASESNLTSEVNDQLVSTTEKVSTNTGNFTSWDGHAYTQKGDQITTTAEMSAGISGGPLVDKDGYVIGVCVSYSARSQNANYAVAADELKALLGGITQCQWTEGPLQQGLNTTSIILIVAGVVIAGLLVALIIGSSKGKKNSRTLVMTGSMAGKSLPLRKGVPVVVGRDPNRCQVVYPKDTAGVSSVHCTITFDGNEVTVADNGSSYGTFVGGTKVEPGKPMVIHRGQEVTFGSDKNSAELH